MEHDHLIAMPNTVPHSPIERLLVISMLPRS
jgi:hypothetical protein